MQSLTPETTVTIADLGLPADLRRQWPAEMAVRVEGPQAIAYQHADYTGGRWVIGWIGRDVSVAAVRQAVIDYHRPDLIARY